MRTLTITLTIPDGAAGLSPATVLRSFAGYLAEFGAADVARGIEDTRRSVDEKITLHASLSPNPRLPR